MNDAPHLRTVLQFGGGKDSLACLYLLRPRWDDITVVWMDTGAAFPETQALMRDVSRMVPHFFRVTSDVLADIAVNGWPVDVVPVAATPLGASYIDAPAGVRVRSWLECCNANMWQPLHNAMVAAGVTRIIRGQRADESYTNPLAFDGAVVDGVTYELPLQTWTAADVMAYLTRAGVTIPAYYGELKSSLDCWSCTAFLDAKGAQLDYLARHHPARHAAVANVLTQIDAATEAARAPLRAAVHALRVR